MKSLVITPNNSDDLKFLKELLEKLGYSAHELSDEEMEDLGLLQAMVNEKREDYVSEEEVRKALTNK